MGWQFCSRRVDWAFLYDYSDLDFFFWSNEGRSNNFYSIRVWVKIFCSIWVGPTFLLFVFVCFWLTEEASISVFKIIFVVVFWLLSQASNLSLVSSWLCCAADIQFECMANLKRNWHEHAIILWSLKDDEFKDINILKRCG